MGLALWLTAIVCATAASQPTMAVAAYRLDDTFRLPGTNATGFVVSVRINAPGPGMTADDFILRLFDDSGRPLGENTTLAIRQHDNDAMKQPWVLLDSRGLLERSYAPLIASKAAVAEQGRKRPIDRPGLYELVYFIGPTVRQASLFVGPDRPNVARVPIGAFKIPWN